MSIGTILEGECEDEHEQMYADVPRPHLEDGANRAQSRSDGMAHASLISEEEEDEGDDNEWHDDAEEDDWDLGVGASLGGARRRSARLSTSTIASQATAETTVDTPSAASTSELQLHASPLDADGAITPSGAGRGVAPIRMAPCMSAPSSRTSSVSAHAADASPRLTPISAVLSALSFSAGRAQGTPATPLAAALSGAQTACAETPTSCGSCTPSRVGDRPAALSRRTSSGKKYRAGLPFGSPSRV